MCSDLNHNQYPIDRECGISLGSNMGDRLAQLMEAVERLKALPDSVRVMALSSIYETEPVDVPAEYGDQPFYNAVVVIQTRMDPLVLAESLHRIEAAMGRVRHAVRNAPRVIDMDLIYAGDCQIDTSSLTVPHPQWARRRFVVEPLAEVRPCLRMPGWTQTVSDILQALPRQPIVKRIDVLQNKTYTR